MRPARTFVGLLLLLATGCAGGAAPSASPSSAAVPVPETRAGQNEETMPELVNGRDVTISLNRNYPPRLYASGIGGRVKIWVWVNTEGRVAKTQLERSSGRPELDDVALRLGHLMRFVPATKNGVPVAVWVAMPITFTVR